LTTVKGELGKVLNQELSKPQVALKDAALKVNPGEPWAEKGIITSIDSLEKWLVEKKAGQADALVNQEEATSSAGQLPGVRSSAVGEVIIARKFRETDLLYDDDDGFGGAPQEVRQPAPKKHQKVSDISPTDRSRAQQPRREVAVRSGPPSPSGVTVKQEPTPARKAPKAPARDAPATNKLASASAAEPSDAALEKKQLM
jgi:hypothetical protein